MMGDRILVASDSRPDAERVVGLLRDEFPDVAISSARDTAAVDFEAHRPVVLVLAFGTLVKAERYYLGLFRASETACKLSHKTVLVCMRDDVRRAYELCRKGYFDDYVVGGADSDPLRLPLIVHRALREMAASLRPGAREVAALAQRLACVARLVAGPLASATRTARARAASLEAAQRDIESVLDRVATLIAGCEGTGLPGNGELARAMAGLGDALGVHARALASAFDRIHESVEDVARLLTAETAATDPLDASE